ncbi:Shr3 amino acid permease chaperone [Lipomyces oligophaga]|uniref:Shr3 amino acid permease chaperone n=1 Tax=Lipomyces oligophaga TaxID=45792 RepID=UPI0034CE80C8
MPTQSRSFSTSVILCATSFFLGALFVNWRYDYTTLWTQNPAESAFDASRAHYALLATEPPLLRNAFHIIVGLGLIGFMMKLYKPSESNKLFDGGSLVLYMAGLIIYLANIRQGFLSALSGDWGDVDEKTGINVLAASQVIIAFTLVGVLGLQLGQYWAEVQDEEELRRYQLEEKKEQSVLIDEAATATASGVDTHNHQSSHHDHHKGANKKRQ